MKQIFITTILLTTFLIPCNGQQETGVAKSINGFEFKAWFGYEKNEKEFESYCLLGTGFFRTISADNTDSLITQWIKNHPAAIILPVYTFGPTMTDYPNSKQTYCWVVDKTDTLNIYLVRQGALPGGTMQRPQTWKEMTGEEKDLWHDNLKPSEKLHMNEKEYQVFIEKVKVAEAYAQNHKLGIWKEYYDVENE